jgi:hypothetical protein
MGSLESVDMYEEGLRIPILKLYNRGAPDQSIFALFEANVRMSHKVLGDIDAQLAANEICRRGVLRMAEEYRLDGLETLATTIIELSDKGMRRRLGQIPDGTYANSLSIPAISDPRLPARPPGSTTRAPARKGATPSTSPCRSRPPTACSPSRRSSTPTCRATPDPGSRSR